MSLAFADPRVDAPTPVHGKVLEGVTDRLTIEVAGDGGGLHGRKPT